MKIAWFTPFRRVSAIGRFSQSVTNCLAGIADVDLWLAEEESEELHDSSLRIVWYRHLHELEPFLAEYDAVIYNMGDQAQNHAPIYEASQRVPGVVILHDYVMHHFFASYYDRRGGWEEYAKVMARWYNSEIVLRDGGWSGSEWRVWETDDVVRYPLFEPALVGCQGVITHSDFVRERVAKSLPCLLRKIHLAYSIDRTSPVASRAELGIPQDHTLMVTTGHVNENKRIHVVLQALAENPGLARKITYVAVGSCEGSYGERVQALCRDLELGFTVRFTGYADPELLRAYLKNADICVNLRWPAMEGGSASCAEQMLFGKPVIVTDTGVYSELPGECVLKVRPEHEIEDLGYHIGKLVDNAHLRAEMGGQARRFADNHFNPSLYARQLLEFCKELSYFRPALSLMDLVAKELKGIGVTSEMAILDSVAREGALLLGGDYDPPILRKSTS